MSDPDDDYLKQLFDNKRKKDLEKKKQSDEIENKLKMLYQEKQRR